MRISSSLVFFALYLGFAATTAIPYAGKFGDRDIDNAGKRSSLDRTPPDPK